MVSSSIKMESLILSKCNNLLVEEKYSHVLKLFPLWLSSFLSSYLITTYLSEATYTKCNMVANLSPSAL